ncbi:MAG: HBL/NHE enterotoxin family protein [Cellulomonas sp.]|nr:HBL/NHE enterotoxin family protein [Rickettsiella sp.]
MERNYFDELVKHANNVVLTDPPKIDKQLEDLFKTIKCLQNYCIKLNTTPDLNWTDFVEFYRKDSIPTKDDKLEQILLSQNVQLTLRKHTAEYLDKLNPKLNEIFDNLMDFSSTFVTFYPELNRSIEDTVSVSKDNDYDVVINELVEEIESNRDKNDKRLQVLNDFLNRFNETFDSLCLLKNYVNVSLEDKKHEIKTLEDELKKLEDKLSTIEMEAINYAFITKTPMNFLFGKDKDKDKDKDKNKDKDKDKEKEKQKKELKDKIAKLHAALIGYDQDYGVLKILFDTSSLFKNSFISVIKDVTEISQGWHSIEVYFASVKASISDENIKNHWVRDNLLPKLKKLNAKFIALTEEIKKIKTILPISIVYCEKNADGKFIIKDNMKISNSKFLEFYVNKFQD